MHVKKGDQVLVLSGVDRDKRGKILSVDAGAGKVIVDGVNVVKKHAKPTRTAPQGGVIERPNPIPASKVMLVCPSCDKPTRHAKAADGSARTCRECGKSID